MSEVIIKTMSEKYIRDIQITKNRLDDISPYLHMGFKEYKGPLTVKEIKNDGEFIVQFEAPEDTFLRGYYSIYEVKLELSYHKVFIIKTTTNKRYIYSN